MFYTGVDFSSSALERSAAAFEAAGISERAEFLRSEIVDVDDNRSADVVVCIDVLFHVESNDRFRNVLLKCAKLARQMVVLTTWNSSMSDVRLSEHCFYWKFPASTPSFESDVPLVPCKTLLAIRPQELLKALEC